MRGVLRRRGPGRLRPREPACRASCCWPSGSRPSSSLRRRRDARSRALQRPRFRALPSSRSPRPRAAPASPAPTRIVARIQAEPGVTLSPVQFFVDGKLSARTRTARRTRSSGPTRTRSSAREIAVAGGRLGGPDRRATTSISSRSKSPIRQRRLERAARAVGRSTHRAVPINGLGRNGLSGLRRRRAADDRHAAA